MSDFIRYFIEEMTKKAIELTYAVMANFLKYVPGVQGVGEAVSIEPCYLTFLPDHLKTNRMCNEAVRRKPLILKFVPGNLQTQEMCKRVVEENPRLLKYVPGRFKTKEICGKAVKEDRDSLQYVPDYFMTQQQLKLWYNNDDWYDDDEIIEWYESYQKRKAQKAKIEKELMPIVWHPSRWWDWCILEEEKRETDKLWA